MGIKVFVNIESILKLNRITASGLVNKPNLEIIRFEYLSEKEPILQDISEGVPEGGIDEITHELKHRDTKLRNLAIIENNGYHCCICGFNFEDFYGEIGKDIIEVHHLIPISDGERITTTKELAVVCPNCHRVLHHNGKKPIPIEDLKKKVEELRELKKKDQISIK
jgi:predicted HNH restriction endonuclease